MGSDDDMSFKVMGAGQTFISVEKQAKESGRIYHCINDFFGGKAFVKLVEIKKGKDAGKSAVVLTLSETVEIPRLEGGAAPAPKQTAKEVANQFPASPQEVKKPKQEKKTAPLQDNNDDNPW